MDCDAAFDQLQISAIRDVAETGLRRATDALSDLTRHPFAMGATSVDGTFCDEVPLLLGGRERLAVGVAMAVGGDVEGHTAMLMPWESAQDLWTLVLGYAPETTREIDDLVGSALLEVGNIVMSGFVSAIADRTRLRIDVRPPGMAIQSAGLLLTSLGVRPPSARTVAVSVQTVMSSRGEDTSCHFLCIPTVASLRYLMGRLVREAA